MTDAVAEVVVDDVSGDAGFEDAFAATRGNEPPVVKEEAPAEVAADPVAEVPVVEPKVEAPVEETVVLNQTEIKSLLSRLEMLDKHSGSLDKVFGHIGSLRQTIDKLQTAQASGEAVELTDEDVAEIKNDFPELGESFRKVLGRALGKARGPAAATVDLEPIKQEFGNKIVEVQHDTHKTLLSYMQPAWEETVASDKFKVWLAAQPEADRARIGNSWNAIELDRALKAFAVDTAPKVVTPPPPKTNKSRLAAAIQPSGVKSPDVSTLSAEDAFATGFQKTLGR